MVEAELPGVILDRIGRVRGVEQDVIECLESLSRDMAGDSTDHNFDSARRLATRHIGAIDELARRRGLPIHVSSRVENQSGSLSRASRLEDLASTLAGLVTAYGALYAAGRLLYDSDLADELAYPHGEEWRDKATVIADVLVAEIHAELLRQGLTCRCVCPACGMGACLCTRNSIETLRELWDRPGPEPGRGIELCITPRPGSEMARVGMDAGDRILVVDGETVQTNGDLQEKLRKYPIGEPIAIQVVRSGRSEEVHAARVSDFP